MDRNEWVYKLSHLQELVRFAYTDADNAYDALSEHGENTKYPVSLGFLNLSFASYLELKRYYHANEDIQHYEHSNFFTSYEKFIFELKQVIIKEDDNTSWLSSAHDDLLDSWKYIDEFIQNGIKSA